MHVSSPAPAAPAATRSDLRAAPSRAAESGFGAVYQAGEPTDAGADTPRGETGGTGRAAAPRDAEAAIAPAGDRGQETSVDLAEIAGAVAAPDEAPLPAERAETAARAPAVEVEDPAAAPVGHRNDLPEEAALATAAPLQAKPAGDAGAPRDQATARSMPQAAAHPPVAAGHRAEAPAAPAADPAPEATPAAQDAPAKPAATPPAAQIAQAASAAPARSVVAEEVSVRRVRHDDAPAADGRTELRTDPAPRADAKPSAATMPTPAPADPLARLTADIVRADAFDPAVADVAAADGRSTAEHAARLEATVRHDAPRPVLQQVAEAARALRDGPVELTLQPEELGKVKMILSADADGVMTLAVQAERSETLDLLRRHINDLARELQGMGFQNLSFSFGQDRASPEGRDERPRDDDAGDRPIAAIPLAQHGFAARSAPAVLAGGLDLRL